MGLIGCPEISVTADQRRVTYPEEQIQLYVKVNVKQSRYRPGVAQRVPGS